MLPSPLPVLLADVGPLVSLLRGKARRAGTRTKWRRPLPALQVNDVGPLVPLLRCKARRAGTRTKWRRWSRSNHTHERQFKTSIAYING